MEFVVFFFISWLVISLYSIVKKHINLLESTFVFLVILIISINFSWIIIDELSFIKVTNQKLAYSGFLLSRSIIIPFLILLFVNGFASTSKGLHKLIMFISLILSLTGLSFLSTFLGITEFKKWNWWFESTYFLSLAIISILCYQIYKKVILGVVNSK